MADRYLVRVRFFGEERDIREFIQPWSAPVAELAAYLPAGDEAAVVWAWQYVHGHIQYPEVAPFDYRYQEAFTESPGGIKVFEPHVPALREAVYDYWQMPAETLAIGIGDCEDTSALLVSILRNRIPADRIFVSIGVWDGYDHAWVTAVADGQAVVLETTAAPTVGLKPEGRAYLPYIRFNDVVFQEVRPGLVLGHPPRYRVALERRRRGQGLLTPR